MLMICRTCGKLVGEKDFSGDSAACPLCGTCGKIDAVPQAVVYRPGDTVPALPFSFRVGETYPVTGEYEQAFALIDQKGQEVYIPKWKINAYFHSKIQEEKDATA